MIVVADSSPLVALTNIGYIDVLPRLFGQVIIPPEISAELSQPRRP
jgi:predicted nucleic acid-binding protein